MDDYDAFVHAAEQAIHDVDYALSQHLRVLALLDNSARLGRHRCVLERTFAWLTRFGCLTIRYERRTDIHLALTTLSCFLAGLGQVSRFS
jgi:IS5 family transposase